MKVLTVGDPTPDNIVTFPLNGEVWERLDGERFEGSATVCEFTPKEIGEAIQRRVSNDEADFAPRETEELLAKDMRWFDKALANVNVGAEIGVKANSRGHSLIIPEDARLNRAEGLTKGDRIAIGPEISPQYLMNTHGTVVEINGAKVRVELDEGDRDRLNRRSNRKWGATVALPKSSVEKLAA